MGAYFLVENGQTQILLERNYKKDFCNVTMNFLSCIVLLKLPDLVKGRPLKAFWHIGGH